MVVSKKDPHNEPQVSLPEVNASVDVGGGKGLWARFLAFSGPAFMVSVGYMDPGNWATDLAGGAKFGYRLLWVILLANIIAILMQVLSARLGIATGRDLAQACREHYPRPVVWILWILCEIAIAACDLAEVLGSAIGLQLLFGIPIMYGVIITAFDVMLLLMLQSYGIRKLEALIMVLVATIGACFAIQLILSKPDWVGVAGGLAPGPLGGEALFIAIGIIGATIMPHNLYLHSALVQSRAVQKTPDGLREAAKFNLVDCVVAMNGAFLVNAAILILAASAFNRTGNLEVASLQQAHGLLSDLLGSVAPIAFAIALLAAGQSSTITGTLAGQIVMEGFVNLRLRPWLRRLLTRLLAIVPAILVIYWKGNSGIDTLLVFSQVILSLQLSFAIVPLVHFSHDRHLMGELATALWVHVLAWISAALIIGLNLKLVFETIVAGLASTGLELQVTQYVLIPVTCFLVPFLAYILLEYRWSKWRGRMIDVLVKPELPETEAILSRQYHRIAIALEAMPEDVQILAGIVPLARAAGSELLLVHVVESATGRFIGTMVDDQEARSDEEYMTGVAGKLREVGLVCRVCLGAGEPENEIARISEEEKVDLIVAGSHGHAFFGDLFYGSTIDELRHLTAIPILTIRVGRT